MKDKRFDQLKAILDEALALIHQTANHQSALATSNMALCDIVKEQQLRIAALENQLDPHSHLNRIGRDQQTLDELAKIRKHEK